MKIQMCISTSGDILYLEKFLNASKILAQNLRSFHNTNSQFSNFLNNFRKEVK